MATPTPKSFAELLQSAVTERGILSRAYQQFHCYSLGNQLLAFSQCLDREIPPGPINTFPRWKELGRHVKRGEKAITLCMPITVKQKDAADTAADDSAVYTRFVYKPRWFVLSQTEGEPLPEPEIPAWDKDQALDALHVREIPFDHVDGNCLGFAREQSIAINPVNPAPAQNAVSRAGARAPGAHGGGPAGGQRDHAPAPCASARPSRSRCSAVRLWICPASPSVAGMSSIGGARATRSRNARRSASSKRPIGSSRPEPMRGCAHNGPRSPAPATGRRPGERATDGHPDRRPVPTGSRRSCAGR